MTSNAASPRAQSTASAAARSVRADGARANDTIQRAKALPSNSAPRLRDPRHDAIPAIAAVTAATVLGAAAAPSGTTTKADQALAIAGAALNMPIATRANPAAVANIR